MFGRVQHTTKTTKQTTKTTKHTTKKAKHKTKTTKIIKVNQQAANSTKTNRKLQIYKTTINIELKKRKQTFSNSRHHFIIVIVIIIILSWSQLILSEGLLTSRLIQRPLTNLDFAKWPFSHKLNFTPNATSMEPVLF